MQIVEGVCDQLCKNRPSVDHRGHREVIVLVDTSAVAFIGNCFEIHQNMLKKSSKLTFR